MSRTRWSIATTIIEREGEPAGSPGVQLTAWAEHSSMPWGAVQRPAGEWLGAASAIAVDVLRAGPFERPSAILCPEPALTRDLRAVLPPDVMVVGTNEPDPGLQMLIEEVGPHLCEGPDQSPFGPAVTDDAVVELHRQSRHTYSRFAELRAIGRVWHFELVAEPGVIRPGSMGLGEGGRGIWLFDDYGERERWYQATALGNPIPDGRHMVLLWMGAADLSEAYVDGVSEFDCVESGPGVWPVLRRRGPSGALHPCAFDYDVATAALVAIAAVVDENAGPRTAGRLTGVELRSVVVVP